MSNTPELILQLVETFESNIDNFKKQNYNEAQVRQQFINPFFEALGWDMQNKAGIALAYSDVIHEDAIKVGGFTKAPDYCFRVGGTRKFFVEAKRPSIDIKSDVSPAYQLRRYAWNAKLPLSILTDFEEFAVYDCRIRPNVNDKPSTARIFLCTYKEYAEKWEQIANIFGKEAVYKGLFDKYASEKTTKRGTTTVDKEFLAEIEEWRNVLAKNIAIRNGKLSVYDLNFAVQKTIDRILFLRICEDRGIERGEQLLGLVNGSRIYPRLFELFEKSDERYNSGIFHFHREKDRPESPDELSANLKVDDDVLKKIIRDLYYPCPYEFSIMPAEILGNVYEQFLGKVIRLTASHQAKVEEKPEVKKAGGVYYTPSYIVDYIVKNTVGKLCEGKTPKQIEKLRILDPACGSGSFLIGAYRYLLDFHRDYYAKEPAKHKKAIYQGKGKQWFLTIDEKKRILLNNIYGVDIDSQAVEVTKLSLLLKVLENETQESLKLFHERALPDLGNNIKCGNSLIGPDFYHNQQLTLFDDQQQRKINAFDWQKEFASIFKQGGFDAVIGNPPYVRSINLKETNETAWNFYRTHYHVASSREWDIYLIFVEQCLGFLKATGKLGFILPNKFLNSQVGENLRSLLSKGKHLEKIVHFGAFQIFHGATTYTCLLFLSRRQKEQIEVARYTGPVNRIEDLCPLPHQDPRFWSSSTVSADSLQSTPWNFTVDGAGLMEKIKRWPGLGNIAEVFQGVGTRADKVYLVEGHGNKTGLVRVFSPEKESEYLLEPIFLKPALRGRSIRRYEIETGLLLIVPYEAICDKMVLVPQNKLAQVAPRMLAYLCDCKSRLNEREDGRFKGEGWYCYGRPQNMNRFEVGEKIVLPDVCKRGTCSFDRDGQWLLDTCYGIARKPETQIDLRYILAILNSPLLTYFLKETGTPLRGGYFRMKTAYLNPLPIRTIDFDKSPDKSKHDKIVSFVEQILELHKKLAEIKNPDEKTRLQRQIDATDSQIDKLVYDLYGLTEEEIKIVEEAGK
jgi:type I restriction-modification system DNA methylase subunit